MVSVRVDNSKLDPGKLIGSTFGKQDGLSFVYFGNDDAWAFALSIISTLKKVKYRYCGNTGSPPLGVESCGCDPMSFPTTEKSDVVVVDLNENSFSTILYMCLEGLLKDDGLLCINGPGSYRFPLFRAMMKEGVISTFRQNEFEERGIVLFRKQTGKFSRIV
jgi:hypothetical protein